MSAPLVFMDTETTGVHPDRQVWEVAMIRRDEHGERERSFFVDVNLSEADPFGLKVGRFYDRHPVGKMLSSSPIDFVRISYSDSFLKSDQAAQAVARWTHGAHVVGAVPNFDTEVLADLIRAHGLFPAWHYHLIDVENLAVGYLAGLHRFDGHECRNGVKTYSVETAFDGPPSLPWDSNDLSRAVGVDPDQFERHTAMGDVRWAMAIYDAVMRGAS